MNGKIIHKVLTRLIFYVACHLFCFVECGLYSSDEIVDESDQSLQYRTDKVIDCLYCPVRYVSRSIPESLEYNPEIHPEHILDPLIDCSEYSFNCRPDCIEYSHSDRFYSFPDSPPVSGKNSGKYVDCSVYKIESESYGNHESLERKREDHFDGCPHTRNNPDNQIFVCFPKF